METQQATTDPAACPAAPMAPAEQLVLAAAQGSPHAFDTLVATYQQLVRRHCLRRGLSSDDTADVSQDVFLKVYRGLSSYQSQNTFENWLHRVTENACIDFRRQHKRRSAVIQPIPTDREGNEMELIGRIADPEAQLHADRTGERTLAALERLSPLLRDAFKLKELEGLRYEQIANRLGVTVGTIKSRIFRARQILTEELADLV